ncbi:MULTISPECIES: acetyltransferase [Thermodesulfovibrio]|jgi:sugar O-acyltransferase (sialic acid O-acetyltransferase NeuD family)|uniref:acetyltransferase n=1 Tax=Thermodesulfovibrio TaxID=28261 RepID=UPI0026237035|nr:acetyltransferase [Thermodesulfovibrio sp.]
MSKERIILIGGGGHCRSVIDVIELTNKFEILGIIDRKENLGKDVLGYKVIGTDNEISNFINERVKFLITIGHIGDATKRIEIFRNLKNLGLQLATVVSPLAYVSKYASIGEGTVVMHHALINAGAKIGNNCIINSKALIEHDAIVEDHCHISTSAIVNGGVVVRSGTFLGSNATVKQYTEIEGFIKAGSVIK